MTPVPGADVAARLASRAGDATWIGVCVRVVDVALAARILLAADRNLEAYQRGGIAAFIAARHEHDAASIAAGYSDRDEGFERFRTRVLDEKPGSDPTFPGDVTRAGTV